MVGTEGTDISVSRICSYVVKCLLLQADFSQDPLQK